MKLNLLPTYVGRGRQIVLFIVIGVLMIFVSLGVSVSMVVRAQKDLDNAKAQALAFDKPVQDAINYSNKVDEIMQPLPILVRNVELAKAMDAHNSVYPEFYKSMFPYIPGFFRITNVQATPNDANNVTLRMTGILKSREQYRELLLALLRIPGATSVVRSGFTAPGTPFLPNITEPDQDPDIVQPDKPILPKDQLQRMDVLIANANRRDPPPAGLWGLGGDGERGPMPKYQAVTVAVTVPGKLQTPNPSATLGVTGAGGGGGGRGGGGGGGGKRAGGGALGGN